jgi:hypothetical protein
MPGYELVKYGSFELSELSVRAYSGIAPGRVSFFPIADRAGETLGPCFLTFSIPVDLPG